MNSQEHWTDFSARDLYGRLSSAGLLAPAAIVIAVLVFAACTTTGTAVGKDIKTGKASEAVTFVWASDPSDSTNGKIEVTLPDGRLYKGRYHQVTKTTMVEDLSGFWDPWTPYWPDWPVPWDVDEDDEEEWDDQTAFITKYDHHIIARLVHGDSSPVMRCRFTLRDPVDGMAGGGHGDCTIGPNERIEDAELSTM